MATTVPTLDRPPGLPPDVSGQMGATPPPMNVGAAISNMGGASAPAPAGPKAQLLAMLDAIKRLVQQAAAMDPAIPPFADKINTLVDAAASAAQPGGMGGDTTSAASALDQTAGAPSASTQPPDNGHAPFPG